MLGSTKYLAKDTSFCEKSLRRVGCCTLLDVVFLSGSPYSARKFLGKLWKVMDVSGAQGGRLLVVLKYVAILSVSE